MCYASTDCHGHVIPGGGSSKGDCCASDGSGLSFSESGDCSNCFSKLSNSLHMHQQNICLVGPFVVIRVCTV